ncbi:hypothetical protein AWB80_06393 [Caballeronia pedi]|uniref:Uncharacterized protein n=1 Tax=Caballeronia pedi TaxID=1777141 RepID=A0A158D8S9_9BURK|nr:hypothetical protein [Caballeronia pedi]SAK90177.1 hypothetical protein AWB80_06393 [Caballeronia pedi]
MKSTFLYLSPLIVTLAACDGNDAASPSSATHAAPAHQIICAAPTFTPASAGRGLITADTPNSDGTRTYPIDAQINIAITTHARAADTLRWTIADTYGNTVASGSFAVPAAATTSTLACTSTLAGYFQIAATLDRAGGQVKSSGTRPDGFASFGVIPNLASAIPAVEYTKQDQHRFGMQGFNDWSAALSLLGISWTIDDREMALMEPDDRFEFDPSTDYLDPFYKSGTVMRLVRLDGLPGGASMHGLNPDHAYIPNDLGYYRNYMARVGQETESIRAKYYPTMSGNYYQVTWEPEVMWKDSDKNLVALYQHVYDGLHSTDPHAVVMGPTESFPMHTTERLQALASLGFAQYIDGVATHGYYDPAGSSPSNPPERLYTESNADNSLLNQMRDLRAEMQQEYKPDMRLFVTETGINYDAGASYGPDYPTPNILFAQGAVVARAHIILLGEGADQTYVFYGPDFPDEIGFGTFFDLDEPQGSVDATNIAPKPAAMAVAALTRILDGTTTLGPVNDLPTGVYAYGFQQLNEGRIITALWTHDNDAWPASNGEFSSTYSVSYTLKVDADGNSGTVQLIDAMGNVSSVPYTNGAVTLTLTESPQYVVSMNASVAKSNTTKPVGYVGM